MSLLLDALKKAKEEKSEGNKEIPQPISSMISLDVEKEIIRLEKKIPSYFSAIEASPSMDMEIDLEDILSPDVPANTLENQLEQNETESDLSFDLDLIDHFEDIDQELEESEQAEKESIDHQFSNEFLSETYPEKPTRSKEDLEDSLEQYKNTANENNKLNEENIDAESNSLSQISPESIKNIIEKTKNKNKKHKINTFIKIFSGVLIVSSSTVFYLVYLEPVINIKKNYRFYITDETAQEVEIKKNKLLDENNQLISETEKIDPNEPNPTDPYNVDSASNVDSTSNAEPESVSLAQPVLDEAANKAHEAENRVHETENNRNLPNKDQIDSTKTMADEKTVSDKKRVFNQKAQPSILPTQITYNANDFNLTKYYSSEKIIEKSSPIEKKEVKIVRLAQEAYTAFHDKNFYHAKNLYTEALRIDSTSRDAILGLAACENKLGHPEKSMAYYRTALQNNPEDDVALAGMLQLSKPENSIQSISLFKHQLEKNKNSAILHYALGNLYAKEKNWAEACYHYENSVEISPLNPDYTYNLAVCYDQVQNTEKALSYYRLAIQNIKNRDYNFNAQEAMQRLQHLEKSIRIKTDE